MLMSEDAFKACVASLNKPGPMERYFIADFKHKIKVRSRVVKKVMVNPRTNE